MNKKLDDVIKYRFGSKRGLLRTAQHYALRVAGKYKAYQEVDFSLVHRIVFVCSGNICRSALAEVVAKNLGLKAESFGLHCRGGDPADPRAVAYADRIGLSLANHVTKNINEYQQRRGDLLVGMEPKHAYSLNKIAGTYPQITLIGLWLPNPKPYIHDPFNTNIDFFNQCEKIVADATQLLAKRVPKHNA
ncbi:hypothetical protein [Marinimicrobium locisalis]|uniref:arsenate reductase/protein-tyrosine-phosphatase family protein n=1 Tax=Marinimicrobium locisalis TaxID=546022 RepID=UPI003221D050